MPGGMSPAAGSTAKGGSSHADGAGSGWGGDGFDMSGIYPHAVPMRSR